MNTLVLSLLYLVCFLAVALWASRFASDASKRSPWVYVFSVAIYCTAWSFYGNIGLASQSGVLHLGLYVGATLGLFLLNPMIKRLVLIKDKFHSTSLADVLAARYNRSQSLSALVTVICLFGIIPYLTIQLIAVIHSAEYLNIAMQWRSGEASETHGLWLVILLALFTIVFGARQLDPTERHPSVMMAVAWASVFKILVWVIAGAIIVSLAWDDFRALVEVIEANPLDTDSVFAPFFHPPASSEWLGMVLLGFFGILLLPRQFHALVVECSDKNHVNKATWALPAYFLLFNIFVLPLTLLGVWYLPELADKDLLLLALPQQLSLPSLSIVIYLGGFAAASSMLVVSVMALSTMMTNHLLVPFVESVAWFRQLRGYLLQVRWLAVALIFAASYGYFTLVQSRYLLIELGSISFVAVLQLAPALVAALYWRRANLVGAFAGILSGALMWFYTSLLPTLIKGGMFSSDMLSEGPWGVALLNPLALFGLSLPVSPHSLFWSLLVNILALVVCSLLWDEKNHKNIAIRNDFMDTAKSVSVSHVLRGIKSGEATIVLAIKLGIASDLLAKYIRPDRVAVLINDCLAQVDIADKDHIDHSELSVFSVALERKLAGLIGMAGAHKAIRASQLITEQENSKITEFYSQLLTNSDISPVDMLEKISFYQDKQALLEDHALQQQQVIDELQVQMRSRERAEAALTELNEKLELMVQERTAQLEGANRELSAAIDTLNTTQSKLVESEKMASLGGLVTGLAHELNTPTGVILTSVTMHLEQLSQLQTRFDNNSLQKSHLDQFLTGSQQNYQLVHKNVNRLISIIDVFKLLDPEGSGEQPELFNLRETISSAYTVFCYKMAADHVSFSLDCDDTIEVVGYRRGLMQALELIIHNAIEHGLKKSDDPKIAITCEVQDNSVHILIKDFGCGMHLDDSKRLFEPFFTTERSRGKLGLGAHIAYNLVAIKMKGHVDVYSKLNEGTEITLTLPLNFHHAFS